MDQVGVLGDQYQGSDDIPVPLPGGPMLPEDPAKKAGYLKSMKIKR